MTVLTLPRAAVLAPLRDWLRAQPSGLACGLDATLNERAVYAGGLAQDAPARSIVVSKVGISADATTTQRTLVQFDVRAERGAAVWCEQNAAQLRSDLENAVPGTRLGDGTPIVRLLGASIEGEVALPDPDDAAPRHAVTALVTTLVVT